MVRNESYPIPLRGAPLSRCQGLSDADPVGRPGKCSSLADAVNQRRRAETKRRLPAWRTAACEGRTRGRSSSCTTSSPTRDRALRDQPARLARRRARRRSARSRGRCTGSPGGSVGLRRRRPGPPLADDAGEVLLGRRRRLLAVRARDDQPRELELRLHRLAGRHRLLGDEPPPVLEHRVRDPHRPAELLVGRRGKRDVVADRRAHLLAVPGDAGAASSARPAARARSASITSRPASRL